MAVACVCGDVEPLWHDLIPGASVSVKPMYCNSDAPRDSKAGCQ